MEVRDVVFTFGPLDDVLIVLTVVGGVDLLFD